jgi:lipopolysaccharide biosynthesis glycosyltransferase
LSKQRNAGTVRAFVRTRIRPQGRRGLARVGPLDRAASRAVGERRARARLLDFYETLRRNFTPRAPAEQPPGAPDVDNLEFAVLWSKIHFDFFETMRIEGRIDHALMAMTRKLLPLDGGRSRARITAQVLERNAELRPIAEICLAVCAMAEPMPEPAWELFRRNDLELVMHLAPHEYLQLTLRYHPEAGGAALTRVLDGELKVSLDPDTWLHVAGYAFAAGFVELAERTVERAEAATAAKVTDPGRSARLGRRAATMREWVARARAAGQPVEVPQGEIPFALVGVKNPDWGGASRDLDDPVESLAALSHLLRHSGLRFTGDDAGLVAAAARLQRDVPPPRQLGGAAGTVRLYEIERNLSDFANVPDGTWTIVSEWFRQPLGGWRHDVPLNPKLRPIFVSFHIAPRQLAAPGVIDYLRAHGPIGCRDWDTTYMLHAAGVPAFFSGALTATVDNVLAPAEARDGAGHGRRPAGPSRTSETVRERDLADSLLAAADELRGHRDTRLRAGTGSVRFYLAARALGCPVGLDVEDVGDHRVVDFVDQSDAAFAAMQAGISDKLAAVVDAVLAGRAEADVYEVWGAACADEVAQAAAQLHSIEGYPSLSFDLAEACKVITEASVTIERTAPAPDGAEINVEFSVDENYKHQLDIVLDSVIEHATRPVRAFVLCRGFERADFDRMARLFPSVSFVWLPTDNVDYGPIPSKIKWATIATMDRTILPNLLPHIDRIIHFDLDAMCLGDLAGLFDIDLAGNAIAAADEPQTVFASGYDTLHRDAARLRRQGQPDLAREFILRTNSHHPFDFDIFNAGIMVLDLAKMRADDFCGRFLPYVQRFGLNGQVVLNVYVGRDRTKLHPDWNRLVRLEVAQPPKIAHWAGPFKPWRPHQYVTGREWWRDQEDRFAARAQALQPVAVKAG